MKSNQTYDIYYDEVADYLEVFFGEPAECYAEEIESGVIIRKHKQTNNIKSIGIFNFKKRTELLAEILRKVNINLPLKIDV